MTSPPPQIWHSDSSIVRYSNGIKRTILNKIWHFFHFCACLGIARNLIQRTSNRRKLGIKPPTFRLQENARSFEVFYFLLKIFHLFKWKYEKKKLKKTDREIVLYFILNNIRINPVLLQKDNFRTSKKQRASLGKKMYKGQLSSSLLLDFRFAVHYRQPGDQFST